LLSDKGHRGDAAQGRAAQHSAVGGRATKQLANNTAADANAGRASPMEAVGSVMGTNESTGLPHGACDASQRGVRWVWSGLGLAVCCTGETGWLGRRVAATPEWIGLGLD
jgi:hypothetical protein